MQLDRRGFLQIGTTTVGGLVLARYTEPFTVFAKPKRHEWIEDKGDYLIIRVPDGKVFSREVLTKPAIVFLGAQAVFAEVTIKGFVNVLTHGRGAVRGCFFDSINYLVYGARRLVVAH